MRPLFEEIAREVQRDRLAEACRGRLAFSVRGRSPRRMRRSLGAGLITVGSRLVEASPSNESHGT